MELKVLTTAGTESGEVVTLRDDIFGAEVSEHAVYLDVKSILANRRQGTHKSKTRAEVRGGGRKPYRQKGTGNARQGSTRSPLMVGGGTIFGPTPHGYDQKVNKKVKALARRSAFSSKAQDGRILVVEDFKLDEIKTKPFAAILKNLGLDEKKTLMLTPEYNVIITRSGKNIQTVNIMSAEKASTYDILNSHTVLFQKAALKKIEETLG
ncbi:50S ribosomal protein L4 [Chlorobium phaeovibrioides]|uniref:Large ribosomal subunit protein uL4 n=2 Tax=Chlorobium phaeovibrioides TaxID=1094 RepID=RL4_CHLPM|nr:50S ribosomal protein L4 [Chlorobium phaeovibrioides]A4SCR0.1 RecName: Full=Large ribosomal subunit protein uL4; AltName: Full=50S ribosomal protein L4 [Chlorobium phaeovibrioides DSM 265]HCD36571.1 50S ribosomal protein L4 [Chlorobium sp.]KAA6231897.1 50S ribosomal protein L4 [Chlorobium phaeovibrioides]MWV53515.1 50S ribosomal protein L4 [Chlorobium phaeovibrioides]QEQ57551.1 50S ribosomal protein L4 [Chlorobium phaeovibrioides]RTY36181.1 50S ribosomal protein L4 [Chlorobium phaeovibrioi